MIIFDEIRYSVQELRNHPIQSNERFNRTKLQPLSVTLIDRIGRIEVLLPISHLIFVLLDINCDAIKKKKKQKMVSPKQCRC